MKRPLSLCSALIALVFPFVTVQACGPFFEPDVFVHAIRPDHPAEFAAGKLGVLLPTYPRSELTLAYRYLNGGTLSAEEQHAYKPSLSYVEIVRTENAADASANGNQPAEPPDPADVWRKAHMRFAGPAPGFEVNRDLNVQNADGSVIDSSYVNCAPPAFVAAAETLNRRAATWGDHNAALQNWIAGQDAVFANCHGGTTVLPPAAPADAPLLLRQDRAYQVAAAQFYASQFGAARDSFQAIAQDGASPWRGVAAYIVARTFIRESFLSPQPDSNNPIATFDPALMKQAQQQLESIQGKDLPGISPHAVQSLLNLIRIRTEPEKRLREIGAALAGPAPDPDYAQDLGDLNWYLNGRLDSLSVRQDTSDEYFHIDNAPYDYRRLTPEQKRPGFENAFKSTSELRSGSPLVDWLITFQSPSDGAKEHALAEWKRTGRPAWLAAAIAKVSASDNAAPALITDAARVAPSSPAWATFTYHRVRLLIDLGRTAEARSELAAASPGVRATGSQSALNLFAGLRIRSAATLDAALADAPRKILERNSQEQSSLDECFGVMQDPKRQYDCRKDTSPVEFSEDAAALFNSAMPLSTLAQAAHSDSLPQQLRQSVAIVTWVRSVLLKNEAIAGEMVPLLPQKVREQAGAGVGFHPLMTILRNPGLRPYLDGGVQRSASYDFVESYGDNWWCHDWIANYGGDATVRAASVAFLSPQTQEAGAKEAKALVGMGGAEVDLGSRVLDYARAHPADPDVPEALYLTLRMIRYGCFHGRPDPDTEVDGRVGTIAREVGAILRRDYSTNPWTKKAAPYVWPAKKEG